MIFVDQNGDGIIDWKDQVVIGQAGMPKWNFSTFTNFKWGNWSLDALFQGASGYTTNFSSAAGYGGISGHQTIAKKFQFENRSLLGANGDIEVLRKFPPAFTTGGVPQSDQRANDFTRIDTFYLRLKTLNIAYMLPQSITSSWGLDYVQVYGSGSNVLTWDNFGVYSGSYDPEILQGLNDRAPGQGDGGVDRAYPNVRTWTAGIKIGF